MEEYTYEIKIPRERVAVLIGKKGEIKREVEQATKTNIDVDSTEGDVLIRGKDSIGMLSAKDVVMAIGRGFNPEIALLLLKQDYCFELISIADYAGKSRNSMERLKGRIIGSEGKSRRTIETLTETNLSVYGKTVGIIGEIANVDCARKAIEKLLEGSQHAGVYKWLEKKRKDLKMSGFAGKGMKQPEE
ncbi:RNA-processing protein [Candidatus Woesearchaeota archaeon CG10_big_fil_rev_8_21_14_0_10_44_13]|nr:MAG: RNA-processing protein [Candidatus Woesearchaeota archaeon CG10_big_fil_rev_8_21_14_0_10_44_13]